MRAAAAAVDRRVQMAMARMALTPTGAVAARAAAALTGAALAMRNRAAPAGQAESIIQAMAAGPAELRRHQERAALAVEAAVAAAVVLTTLTEASAALVELMASHMGRAAAEEAAPLQVAAQARAALAAEAVAQVIIRRQQFQAATASRATSGLRILQHSLLNLAEGTRIWLTEH